MRRSIASLVTDAMHAFGRAKERSCCVQPAVPILFFGDLDAYRNSPLRVLTVGLNPSLHEFPEDEPFRRFPLAAGACGRDPSRYLEAMSAYFRTDPYRGWFNSYERLLNGMDASYYDGRSSTALHTDICSPVATNPTGSRLGKADRDALAHDGRPLWHGLVEQLRPQVVVLSVARRYLEDIEFDAMNDWEVIHCVRRNTDGSLRRRPYGSPASAGIVPVPCLGRSGPLVTASVTGADIANSEKRREAKRQWIARRRAKRRAAGVCVGCGGPVTPVNPEAPALVKRKRGRPRTGVYCDECLDRKGGQRDEKLTDIERRLEELERRLYR